MTDARGGADVEFVNSLGPWADTVTVCSYLGIAPDSIDQLREQRLVLGVLFGDAWLYPAQQFHKDGVVPGLDRVLAELLPAATTLTVASMLAETAYSDSDETYWGLLREGEIDALVDWAVRTARQFTQR